MKNKQEIFKQSLKSLQNYKELKKEYAKEMTTAKSLTELDGIATRYKKLDQYFKMQLHLIINRQTI